MIIIGISGKKHSGKDEICKIIKQVCHEKTLSVERIGFADELKIDLCRLCGVTLDYLEANKEQFRLMMQGYGTDFRRKQNPNCWSQRWLNSIYNSCNSELDVVIVPDVRFNNEFNTIRNRRGFLFKVVRKQFELGGHKELTYNEPKDNHLSETDLDNRTDFDCEIVNSGTLEQLNKEVRLKLEMYKILCINQKTAQH